MPRAISHAANRESPVQDFMEQLLLVAVCAQFGERDEGVIDTPIGAIVEHEERLLLLPAWCGRTTKAALLRPIALCRAP